MFTVNKILSDIKKAALSTAPLFYFLNLRIFDFLLRPNYFSKAYLLATSVQLITLKNASI
jgi:hypothetical protein